MISLCKDTIHALIERTGLKKVALAERCGMTDSRLSRIIHRRVMANDREQRALAKALETPVQKLFEEGQNAV